MIPRKILKSNFSSAGPTQFFEVSKKTKKKIINEDDVVMITITVWKCQMLFLPCTEIDKSFTCSTV